MRVSYILAAIVIIVTVLGLRGRSSRLEGRTIGPSATDKIARKWDAKRYGEAAEALAALLDVHLQRGDPISQTLLTACNSWDATVGVHLSPEDPVLRAMREARRKFTAADLALSLQPAIDSGLPEVAPAATLNLGLLRAEWGDEVGAGAAYRLAIDSGDADAAPTAALNLGLLRADIGDLGGAGMAYQLAIDSGHPDAAPKAALLLGELAVGFFSDRSGAAAAYQLAIDSGHADWAPTAALSLGVLREGQGDPVGAAAAYQLAIDSRSRRRSRAGPRAAQPPLEDSPLPWNL
jgi:hypothetical protein